MSVNVITHELFSSLPCIDGRGETRDYSGRMQLDPPWDQATRDEFVKSVYKNSAAGVRFGLLVPCSMEGHDESDHLFKGSLIGVQLKYRKLPEPHFAILGQLAMGDELFDAFRQGLLPGLSVDFAPSANWRGLGGPDKVGVHICRVTFSGTVPVAQPWLHEVQNLDPDAPTESVLQFSFLPDSETPLPSEGNTTETLEADPVDEEKIKALIVATLQEVLPQMVGDLVKSAEAAEGEGTEMAAGEGEKKDAPPPAPPAEEKKAAESPEMAQMKAQMAAVYDFAIDGEIQRLKLPTDMAKQFRTLAGKAGLQFARETFEPLAKFATAPTGSAGFEFARSSSGASTDDELIREYKKFGVSDDVIKSALAKAEARKANRG